MADNSVITQSGLAGLFGTPGYDPRAEMERAAAFKNAQLSPMQQLSARAIGSGKAAGRELAGELGFDALAGTALGGAGASMAYNALSNPYEEPF